VATQVAATATPRDRLFWLRLGVLAAFASFVAVWMARPYVWGDTPFVLDGTNAFLDCLSSHDFVACRYSGQLDPFEGLTSPIGDWPLLQYIPDIVAVKLGANGHHARELILIAVGVAAVVGSLGLAYLVLQRAGQRAWFWGFLFVLLSSPLLAYAGTTAGEALAAGLLVCLVAAAVLQASPPLVALAAVGACVTKETSYPFVVLLGVLGLALATKRTGRSIRPHLIWGAAGVALAVVMASLFNIVRFGSVLNKNYLEAPLHTPTIGRVLDYSVALFVSPSGGIFVFWPTASTLLVLACLLPLTNTGRRLDLLPALVLVAVVVGVTLSFASWWSPFGWAAYGPRLTLPWVLPLVLLALVAYGEPLGRIANCALAPTWGLFAIFAVGFVLALPHVGQMWKQDAKAAFFEQTNPPCDPPWRIGVERFHRCQNHEIWLSRPMGLYSIRSVATTGGVLLALVLATGLLGCLVLLRDELGGRRSVHG
jgi:hypothetical protein